MAVFVNFYPTVIPIVTPTDQQLNVYKKTLEKQGTAQPSVHIGYACITSGASFQSWKESLNKAAAFHTAFQI